MCNWLNSTISSITNRQRYYHLIPNKNQTNGNTYLVIDPNQTHKIWKFQIKSTDIENPNRKEKARILPVIMKLHCRWCSGKEIESVKWCSGQIQEDWNTKDYIFKRKQLK